MAEKQTFRVAAEKKDVELMTEALSDDVVLHSPVLFNGFEGREAVGLILSHVAEVLEGLTYTDEALGDGTAVLRFKARVGELELEGIDYLTLDEDGQGLRPDRLHAPALGAHRFQRADGRAPRRRASQQLESPLIRGSVRVVKGDWL